MKLDAVPQPPAGREMRAWLLILDEREPTGRGRPFGRGGGQKPLPDVKARHWRYVVRPLTWRSVPAPWRPTGNYF